MHRGLHNPHTVGRYTTPNSEKHFCREPSECYADPYYQRRPEFDAHGATTVPAKNGVLSQDELARENENLGFPAKKKILNLHGASTNKNDPWGIFLVGWHRGTVGVRSTTAQPDGAYYPRAPGDTSGPWRRALAPDVVSERRV